MVAPPAEPLAKVTVEPAIVRVRPPPLATTSVMPVKLSAPVVVMPAVGKVSVPPDRSSRLPAPSVSPALASRSPPVRM